MTDRLTDEQVRELWERSKAAQANADIRKCWDEAYAELGIARPAVGSDYNQVREMAYRLCVQRKLPSHLPLLDERDPPGWADVRLLLAEVRRARGME